MRGWIVGIALALSATASAQSTDPAEQAALDRATQRGTLIFAYDRAAWLGTDDLRAKLPDFATKVGGYLADGTATATRLVFYDKQAVPQAVYAASFENGKLTGSKLFAAAEDRALSPAQRRMIDALAKARSVIVGTPGLFTCGKAPFNTVVLPPATPDAVVPVYFLTPQADLTSLPFGGHYEVDVAADGGTTTRSFTKSCLSMPLNAKAANVTGKPIGIVVSHLLDPVPTEIHVFSSFAAHQHVYVLTMKPSSRLWVIEGNRISAPRAIAN